MTMMTMKWLSSIEWERKLPTRNTAERVGFFHKDSCYSAAVRSKDIFSRLEEAQTRGSTTAEVMAYRELTCSGPTPCWERSRISQSLFFVGLITIDGGPLSRGPDNIVCHRRGNWHLSLLAVSRTRGRTVTSGGCWWCEVAGYLNDKKKFWLILLV